MVANILVGMLCAHLLCFSVMFWLVSKRLHGKKMGMDFFGSMPFCVELDNLKDTDAPIHQPAAMLVAAD